MQAAPDTCAKAKLPPDSKLGFVTQEGRKGKGREERKAKKAKKAKDKTWAVKVQQRPRSLRDTSPNLSQPSESQPDSRFAV